MYSGTINTALQRTERAISYRYHIVSSHNNQLQHNKIKTMWVKFTVRHMYLSRQCLPGTHKTN